MNPVFEGWRRRPDDYAGRPEIEDGGKRLVCLVEQRVGHPLDRCDETDAIAELIVAAPKLVESLGVALWYWQQYAATHYAVGPTEMEDLRSAQHVLGDLADKLGCTCRPLSG